MIVEEARLYVGTPYKHKGRSRSGLDCAGLLLLIGRKFGVIPKDYDFTEYGEQWDSKGFLQEFNKLGTRVYRRDEWREGDVLVFKQGINPNHCGFYTLPNNVPSVLHASNHKRINKVIEHRLTDKLKSQIAGAYRFKWLF